MMAKACLPDAVRPGSPDLVSVLMSVDAVLATGLWEYNPQLRSGGTARVPARRRVRSMVPGRFVAAMAQSASARPNEPKKLLIYKESHFQTIGLKRALGRQ
jgi:hypothetical protein